MAHEGAEVAELVRRYASRRPSWRLYSVLGTGALKRLDEWQTPDNPEDLIDTIEKRSARLANIAGNQGVQTFELQVVEGEGEQERVLATEQWRVAPELLPGGFPIAGELANDAGQMSQMMRHNEALFRMAFAATQQASKSYEGQLARLSRELEQSQKTNLRAFKVLEEMSQLDHTRRLETAVFERDTKLKGAMADKIGNLLPLVGHAITKKLNPSGAALSSAKVAQSLFESIDASQLDSILGALTPEQRAMVITLYKELVESKEKEQQRAADEAGKKTESTH